MKGIYWWTLTFKKSVIYLNYTSYNYTLCTWTCLFYNVIKEKHFHSHPGEAIAAAWAITKNRHFLWGREFTLISDCVALQWLMNYDGTNHAVRRLQLEMTGYSFTVVHRAGRMLEDANFFSRLADNTHIDPLIKDYLSFARQIFRIIYHLRNLCNYKTCPDEEEGNSTTIPLCLLHSFIVKIAIIAFLTTTQI